VLVLLTILRHSLSSSGGLVKNSTPDTEHKILKSFNHGKYFFILKLKRPAQWPVFLKYLSYCPWLFGSLRRASQKTSNTLLKQS
jgi:hypothetical protein|tara:strand:+ start:77 stop:328 length:252 start_codon:yes stop_codon:yes gene_type:complete